MLNIRKDDSEPTTLHDERVQQLVYRLSHDLNAPLRGICGLSELVQKKYQDDLDEKGQHWLSLINKDCQKMQSQLNGLLTYSRLVTRMEEEQVIDLNQYVDNALILCNKKYPDKHIELFCLDRLPVINGVGAHWKLLILAIMENSICYQALENSVVKIEFSFSITSTGSEEEACQLIIDDNGLGVEEKDYLFIIGMLQRLNRDIESDVEGVGMGLAYCERILELCGGKISFDKSPAGGLRVLCHLPKTMMA